MVAPMPLEGVQAIVLTQAWAGSFCTELLAMMGADVIQIESRRRLDSWRGGYEAPIAPALRDAPGARHPWNCSPNFNSVNLNKREITIDLQAPEGIDIFRRLVPYADVVAENFSPRVMGNLGIDYEALTRLRPDIIVASLSAYGHSGPWRDVPGIGGTIEPTSGMSALLGYRDGAPLNSGSMYPDAVAGYYGFAAIVTALHHRNRTGEGQHIDLSMQEANLTFIGDAALEYAVTGEVRGRAGNRHATFAPHGIYPARGDDQRGDNQGGGEQWIALAAESEEQWRALCAVAGRPGWAADPRFDGRAARKANEDALDAEIAAWTAGQPRDALAARLGEAGLPAAPVLDAREVAADPVLRARGFVVDVEHPETGTHPHAGVPFRLSETPPRVTRAAPLMGEHSAEVFERLLGIDAAQYEELVRTNVSGAGPPQ